MKAKKISFNNIKIGQKAFFQKIVTDNDVRTFSLISGDYNPLHLDDVYAQKRKFKSKIVHGMFMAGLVSQLIGMKLPGEKALLVKECLEFKKPTYVLDKLRVEGLVENKSHASQMIEISIKITRKKELLVKGVVHVIILK